jgi:ATP-dependent exoDNAse (exonuclease V) alpha subunit
MMILTDKQKYVLYKIVQGVKQENKLEQTLGGYAGTGKSSILKYIVQFLPNFGVCAYTGKAADVLRRKGMTAQTIHSLIYKPVIENGRLVGFDLTPRDELELDGFAVDEASMVSKDIYQDMRSYGIPMIFVGDHGQLEPIGTDFNLMKNPEYTLEEIHRNAGDIAKFAEKLRFGRRPSRADESDKVELLNQRRLNAHDYLRVDQVICAYNKTRVQVNNEIREAMGFSGVLQVGERIMCLKNNKKLRLFNGMQGYVRNLYEDGRTGRKLMDLQVDDDIYEGLWYDTRQFGKERPDTSDYIGRDNPNPFDYAYCITAHKSQGSEAPRVLVIEQKCAKWDHRRWAYTAASRAKELLLWAA